jgi:sulfate transport system permease protein
VLRPDFGRIFWRLATTDHGLHALAAYRLTFGAALAQFAGTDQRRVRLAGRAWVLVRYRIPRQSVLRRPGGFPLRAPHRRRRDSRCPSLFAANGWLGQWLVPLGIKGAFTPLGVVIALTFIGLPFVVRTLQPVLQNFEREVEEAAATLGAGRLRTFVT